MSVVGVAVVLVAVRRLVHLAGEFLAGLSFLCAWALYRAGQTSVVISFPVLAVACPPGSPCGRVSGSKLKGCMGSHLSLVERRLPSPRRRLEEVIDHLSSRKKGRKEGRGGPPRRVSIDLGASGTRNERSAKRRFTP